MTMARLIDWFTRLLPLWVIVSGIIAYLYPDLFVPLKSYMEPAFAFTMLGKGLVSD